MSLLFNPKFANTGRPKSGAHSEGSKSPCPRMLDIERRKLEVDLRFVQTALTMRESELKGLYNRCNGERERYEREIIALRRNHDAIVNMVREQMEQEKTYMKEQMEQEKTYMKEQMDYMREQLEAKVKQILETEARCEQLTITCNEAVARERQILEEILASKLNVTEESEESLTVREQTHDHTMELLRQKWEAEKTNLQEQLTFSQVEVNSLKDDLQQYKNRYQKAVMDIEHFEKRLQTVQDSLTEANIRKEECQEENVKLKTQCKNYEDVIYKLNNENEMYKHENTQLNNANRRLQANCGKIRDRFKVHTDFPRTDGADSIGDFSMQSQSTSGPFCNRGGRERHLPYTTRNICFTSTQISSCQQSPDSDTTSAKTKVKKQRRLALSNFSGSFIPNSLENNLDQSFSSPRFFNLLSSECNSDITPASVSSISNDSSDENSSSKRPLYPSPSASDNENHADSPVGTPQPAVFYIQNDTQSDIVPVHPELEDDFRTPIASVRRHEKTNLSDSNNWHLDDMELDNQDEDLMEPLSTTLPPARVGNDLWIPEHTLIDTFVFVRVHSAMPGRVPRYYVALVTGVRNDPGDQGALKILRVDFFMRSRHRTEYVFNKDEADIGYEVKESEVVSYLPKPTRLEGRVDKYTFNYDFQPYRMGSSRWAEPT